MTNSPASDFYQKSYQFPFQMYAKGKLIKKLVDDNDKIQNNLKFACQMSHPEWFAVSFQIVTLKEKPDQQFFNCLVKPMLRNNYPITQVNPRK